MIESTQRSIYMLASSGKCSVGDPYAAELQQRILYGLYLKRKLITRASGVPEVMLRI